MELFTPMGSLKTHFSDYRIGLLILIQIILLHYNVLHSQTEFDPSYGNPE